MSFVDTIEVNLYGLSVEDALNKVKETMLSNRYKKCEICFVLGKGKKHSSDNEPVLKSSVEQWLLSNYYKPHLYDINRGHIYVNSDSYHWESSWLKSDYAAFRIIDSSQGYEARRNQKKSCCSCFCCICGTIILILVIAILLLSV